MRQKPKILNIKTIARTRMFHIEKMDIEFHNGQRREYERLNPPGNGSVLVVPMLDAQTVLMIYEYSGGTDKYELALTKGRIDAGETPLEAANREIIEEIGYGAQQLSFVKTLTIAPGYQSNFTHIILAQDLYSASAKGDEPEPLKVVEHKLSTLETLVYNEDLTEARSIAALYMVREIIKNQR